MKKTMKKWVAVMASALILVGPVSSSVNAQTTYDEAFFNELTQANQTYEAVKFDGMLHVSTTSQGQSADLGHLDFSGAFNGLPLGFSFDGKLTSALLGGEVLVAQAYLQNSVAYVGLPGAELSTTQWQAIDVTEQQQQIIDAFKESVAQAAAKPELTATINQKYTDVTETDTDYIITLKQDINAEELWTDVQQVVDLETLKEQAITQVEEQTGEPVTEEQRAQLDQMYSPEAIAQFLNLNPIVESVYDKETKKLKQIRFEVNVVTAEFVPSDAETEQANFLPENILVKMEINLSEHDVAQDIVVPDEALATEVKTLEQLEQEAKEAEEAMESMAEETTEAAE